MRLLDLIDDILNKLTMYRLLVYGLGLLAAIAVALSAFGSLPLKPGSLVLSLVILLAVSYTANKVLAGIWRAVPNQESWLLTALILFFVLTPATTAVKAIALGVAALVAIASKYMLARNNKHIFNPAAFAAVTVGLLGLTPATWWVGNNTLWPYVLVLGLLVVRKVRRFGMLLAFVLTSAAAGILISMHTQSLGEFVKPLLLTSPLLFLGTIMLTEPSTMPARKNQCLIFGGLVGLLYGFHPHFAGFNVYPETALVIGNLYAYAVSPKYKTNLVLQEIQKISERVYNYVFVPDRQLAYQPGQYMEWTLPQVPFDGRGNRRTFTIASSPTEQTVMMGVKFYEPASSYKQVLGGLKPGDRMVAGQIAGNFVLPADAKQKLLFIAGGIGITPFRSMLKYLEDRREQRDIVLVYLVSDPQEIGYRDILQEAVTSGMRIIPVLTKPSDAAWQGLTGDLSSELLQHYVPDLSDRKVYISGPNGMVTHAKRLLLKMGTKRKDITTDFFSGY